MKRKTKLLLFYITIFALSALISNIIAKSITQKKTIEPPLTNIIEEEEPQTINVPIMTFTQEEAESLLERFKREKEEAERREAARRAAAVYNATYSPKYFRNAGRIWWGGWSWTWYSERILPGYGLRIPGRHTDALGYVRDGNGYLCLASDVLRKGTVIETPFGSYGKVYDCGCGNNYTVDVYVGW